MRTAIATRATAAILAVALPITAMPAVHAAPANNEVVKSQENTADKVDTDSATEEQQVEEIAKFLEQVDKAPSEKDAHRILEERFSQEELNGAAEELGVSPEEMFADGGAQDGAKLPEDPANNEESFGSFMRCIAGKAGNDLKSVIYSKDVLRAISKKQYKKAALAIVRHLAKQGIKRNIVVLGIQLGWYAFQCRGKW